MALLFKLIALIVRIWDHDTSEFFNEIRSSVKEQRRWKSNPNWWLTKRVTKYEQATESQVKDACNFFWTAVWKTPIYNLTHDTVSVRLATTTVLAAPFIFIVSAIIGWGHSINVILVIFLYMMFLISIILGLIRLVERYSEKHPIKQKENSKKGILQMTLKELWTVGGIGGRIYLFFILLLLLIVSPALIICLAVLAVIVPILYFCLVWGPSKVKERYCPIRES